MTEIGAPRAGRRASPRRSRIATDDCDGVFLSVDIDVCDPGHAPGTGTPEPGGLTARQLLDAVRRICLELPVVGMDVVEVSPPYDHADITAALANRVVLEALSAIARRRRDTAGGTPWDPALPSSQNGTPREPSARSADRRRVPADRRVLRRDRGVGERWRFAAIELREPAKASCGLAARRPGAREARVCCGTARPTRPTRRVVVAHRRRGASLVAPARRQPNYHRRRVARGDEALRAHPEVVEALAARGITDLSLVLIDVWAYGAARCPSSTRGPPAGLDRRLVAGDAGAATRTRTRSTGCTASST